MTPAQSPGQGVPVAGWEVGAPKTFLWAIAKDMRGEENKNGDAEDS